MNGGELHYQRNVATANRDEIILDLERSISEIESCGGSMEKLSFGFEYGGEEGIVISGNEAKRIVELLKEKI
jgi:hypothetical protein